MDSVEVEIVSEERASRLEVIVRVFYGTVALVILGILLWVVGILSIVNFFSCLILAKRVAPGFIASVVEQMARVYAYVFFVTDERPPLVP